MDYKRDKHKFVCTGVELNTPVNLQPPGKYPYLHNVRAYQGGGLNTRAGLVQLNTAALGDLDIHTLVRMNDYFTVDFIRFVGAGTNLYAGTANFSVIAGGFSGSAYSIVPYRPDQAVRDWAYVMSAGKSVKVNAALDIRKVGVQPPLHPPEANLRLPEWSAQPIIQMGWTIDGPGTEPLPEDKYDGAAVRFYLPDGGNSPWASIVPDNTGKYWEIGQYELAWIGGAGVVVEELHHCPEPTNVTGAVSAITVGSITSMQPAANVKGLRRNTVGQFGNGDFNRVIAINPDSTQINSFQFIGSGGGAGGSISVPSTSFRVPGFDYNGAIAYPSITTTITGTGVTKLTQKQGLPGWNMASADATTFGPNDYFTFSVYVSSLEKLDSIKLLLDTDPGTDGSTMTEDIGKKNALYFLATADDFDGNYAWKTFRIRIADLIRVGTNNSCGLGSITAVQLIVTPNADNDSADTLDIKLGSIYTSGGFGLDTATNLTPYQYRYRYRASETGARSNPSPATASGMFAQRQSATINFEASSDPQVDKIDIERFGGTNLEWHYIGTVDNGVANFVDGATDGEILTVPGLETDRYETFPIIQPPYSSLVNVAGCYIEFVSGFPFDPEWARGSEIVVNGKLTTLQANPDGTHMIVADSLGGQQNVFIEMAQPIKAAQSLPVMWGPFYECLFGCQDPLAPGTLYFTNPSDPDSSSVLNNIEITTPSERLMNGCMFDGHSYVWSDQRMFGILPINNPNTPEFKFQYTEVPTAHGLFATWAFCVGPRIWYLSSDGIYETVGGEPVCITNDIQPLFPKGDRPGFAVNGFQPVQMDKPGQATAEGSLRLSYHNGFLFFDYIDTANVPRSMVYDIVEKAWFPDTYFEDNPGRAITVRYSEFGSSGGDEAESLLCGTNFGLLGLAGSVGAGQNNDFGDAIHCRVDTPAMDFGDPRAKKIYGELVYELNTATIPVTAQPWLNNYATSLPSEVFTNNVQGILNPQDLGNGIGVFAQNLGVRFTWQSSTLISGLYGYEVSYLERPEDTFTRADDWGDGGYGGSKFVRGFLVEADTMGAAKTVVFDMDQGAVETYEMTHDGQTVHCYSVKPQAIGTLLRLRPIEAIPWREFRVSWIYEQYPELSDIVTPYEDCGFQGPKLMRGVDIEALGGPAVTEVEIDGGLGAYSLTLDHTNITALHTKPYAFRKPFIATELRLNPATAIRLGKRRWIFDPYPDLSPLITPYTDGGYDGAKFVQGLKLEAAGSANITVEYDGDQTGPNFDADHTDSDGVGVLLTKAYSFQNPFIAHDLRLSTTGDTDIMRLGKITWVYQPAPELVTHWVTQGSSFGIPGYLFLKDGYIAHQSTADLILTVIMADFGTVSFTIPASGGLYMKNYILLGTGITRTLKDKLFRFRVDSAQPFRLFERDCEIRAHPWDGGQYVVLRPFGDVEGPDGAKI